MSGSSGQPRADRAPPEVTVPAEYLAHLVDIAARFRVRPEQLLRGTGIKHAVLERPNGAVPKDPFHAVVERAITLTEEPGLGFYYGLSLKLSSHGAVGLLAMTSGTMGDAIAILERYTQLRAHDLVVRSVRTGGELAVAFRNRVPLALEVFFSEAMFIMLLQMGRALVGHPVAARCEFSFAEPPHFKRFAHLLPADVRFGMHENRLVVPASLLDEAVLTSDRVVARRIERECQRELDELRERASFLTRLQRQIRPEQGDFPSLEELAERMHSSTRTLKRKLALQGTSYRKLVDELRKARAVELLERDDPMALEQIASQLGYADTASLHRSFRRWFKTTPSTFRERPPQAHHVGRAR